MTEYYIPTGDGESEFVEKRSRFLGRVWRVSDEEEARACIEQTKKFHYDARHNCWCYRLRDGGVERYSDDGEPQGTAGQPMLGVFQKEEVWDVCCVSTRYFGGILLGTGGLVRAYTQSAKDALDSAGVSVVRRWVSFRVGCPYPLFERIRQETAALGGVVDGTDYADQVTLFLLLPEERGEEFATRVVDLTSGAVTPEQTGQQLRDVPWREAKG